MLSEKEKKVLVYISNHGLDISQRPFLGVGNALEMREEDVMQVLVGLKEKGVIVSLRAVINHTKAGYKANALIAWRLNPRASDAIKRVFIENDLISHCYEREPQDGFDYNIFTVMHAKDRTRIERFASEVAKAFAVDYLLLFTEKELKKVKLDLKGLLCSES